MSKILLNLILVISISWGAEAGLPPLDPVVGEALALFEPAVAADHDVGPAAPMEDDIWWDAPENIAALIAVVDAMVVPAPPVVPVPAPVGGIVGAFVPPAAPLNPLALAIKHERAHAHAAAFPFAVMGRSFLCNVQKAWLRHWKAVLAARHDFTHLQKTYPLGHAIPSFGWVEVERFGPRDEICQMCGRQHIHVVVHAHNDHAPVGFQDLRVGIDCIVFMEATQAIVWQTAFDNDTPLP
jgi:hypothetical protein